MGLCSLKRSTRSVEAQNVSVDAFIDGAQRYAAGERRLSDAAAQSCLTGQPSLLPVTVCSARRRATFSLNESTIEKLSQLSEQTGISRSRLIRIWVERTCKFGDIIDLTYDPTP